ncbi:hypothetical protein [Pseudodesulfovibrio sp.]
MTFRTTINSKGDPKKLIRRGLKSMFPNYDRPEPATPPVDTESDRKRSES